MTVETPIEHPAPRTPGGMGLTIPIAKALAHLMLVHEAAHRDWPLTHEAASAEINEAAGHTGDVIADRVLFTDHLISTLAIWSLDLNAYAMQLIITARAEPDAPFTTDSLPLLKAEITNTWDLLALIDRELAGLDRADRGARP